MKRPKRKRRPSSSASGRPLDEGAYICPSCGESIVVPVDRSGGADQEYVEDCPVCCHPNVIRVEYFGEDEPPRVSAEAE